MKTLNDYLMQLEAACQEAGVSLDDAAKAEGIPNITLWRWRNGKAQPRQGTAEQLLERIQQMEAERLTERLREIGGM